MCLLPIHALALLTLNKVPSSSQSRTINDHYHHYQGRTTQWWICLANLKLYFYQFFGDTKARYVSDLSHAAVYAGNTMATTLTTTIITTTNRQRIDQ